MSILRFHDSDLWKNFADGVIQSINEALTMMRSQVGHLPAIYDELCLNDLLYWYIREALRTGEHPHLVQCLCPPNTPKPRSPANGLLDPPIPDFQFRIADSQEPDILKAQVSFDIECKLLGPPTSKSWKLNENYFQHGISRFQDDRHRYGEHTPVGIMVGYLRPGQSAADVFIEVNAQCAMTQTSLLVLVDPPGWNKANASRLEQRLRRTYSVDDFNLLHLWLEIDSSMEAPSTRGLVPLSPQNIKALCQKAQIRREKLSSKKDDARKSSKKENASAKHKPASEKDAEGGIDRNSASVMAT